MNRPQLSVSNCAPLPRRTGHGDFPHPALAKVLCSRKHSQGHQSKVGEVSREADTLTSAPTPLAATTQMPSQPITHEARCLLSPRGVQSAFLVETSRLMLASPFQAGWPLPYFAVTRPNRVRGTLRLAHLPSPASASRIAPCRLRVGYMTFDLLS